MSFFMETEKENKLSFVDVQVIRTQGKFTSTIYLKLLLVMYIVILKVFYLRFTSLVWCIL